MSLIANFFIRQPDDPKHFVDQFVEGMKHLSDYYLEHLDELKDGEFRIELHIDNA